jgi:putative ABC transport system permease protein
VTARLHKILGDLSSSKARTALVAMSIAVGVAAVGMVAGARAMMLRSLDRSRTEAAFPNATIVTAERFGPRIVARVRSLPEVRDVDARTIVDARIRTPAGAWRNLTLAALPSYLTVRIARVSSERGAWPPPPGGLLVERASLGPLGARIGSTVRVRLPSGTASVLRVAGTVHDLNSPSTKTSGVLYGNVTDGTLRRLGDSGGFNELNLTVTGDAHVKHHVELTTGRVRAVLRRAGLHVQTVTIPEAGTFWASDAVRSMVLLLTVLAVVCVLLAGFLVITIISALVAQQVRQIGVMKAIGARTRDTAALYLATTTVFGTVGLVIAIPLAGLAAFVLVSYSTGLINLDLRGFSLPPSVVMLELGAGLLVPLAAALAPALAGSRITVRDAVAAHGVGLRTGPGIADRSAERLRRLPAAIRLALTNTFRRTGRLLLTLATLTLAGTVFVAVLGVRASLDRTLDDAVKYRNYDVDVSLDRPYPTVLLRRLTAGVAGLARVEPWASEGASRVRADGSESATFSLVGAPLGTSLIRPIVLKGRWLRPRDRDAVVVNSDVLKSEHRLSVGDGIELAVNGSSSRWRVVGIVRGILLGPVIYAGYAAAARAAHESGLARRLEIVGTRHDATAESGLARRVEMRLRAAGLRVGWLETTADRRAVDNANFRVLVSFLLSMAILLVVVGGLGLAGTLGINVLERRREIGILRAIGAGDGDVFQLVVLEALVVGTLGWVLSLPLAVPLSRVLSDQVGRRFIGAPLSYSWSWGGAFLWLGVVLVASLLASLLPARRAAHVSVRDALAFE